MRYIRRRYRRRLQEGRDRFTSLDVNRTLNGVPQFQGRNDLLNCVSEFCRFSGVSSQAVPMDRAKEGTSLDFQIAELPSRRTVYFAVLSLAFVPSHTVWVSGSVLFHTPCPQTCL